MLALVLDTSGVDYHFYANDTQVYIRILNIEDAKFFFISVLLIIQNLDGK